MLFGSPEHLTFLRYEILSPHQRYLDCLCSVIHDPFRACLVSYERREDEVFNGLYLLLSYLHILIVAMLSKHEAG